MLSFVCALLIGLLAASRLSATGICVLALLVPMIDGAIALASGAGLWSLVAAAAVVLAYNLGLCLSVARAVLAGPAEIS